MTCCPCRSSMLPCRRWRAQFWISVVPWTSVDEQVITRSPLTVSRSVWWSGVSHRWWNSWWKCRRLSPILPCFSRLWSKNVDIPTSVHGVSGSLQGFLPEQSSAQWTASQIADIPVPGCGVSGSLQGFSPGQYSAQRTASQIADIPVPGCGVSGSLQGFSPGQYSSQRTASQIADILVPGRGVYGSLKVLSQNRVRRSGLLRRSLTFQFLVVEVPAVFLVFPQYRVQQLYMFLRNAFLSGLSRSVLVEIFLLVVQVFTVLSQDRVQQLVLELMAVVEVFKALSQDRVPPLVVEMSEWRCPRSCCCFAWGRTVSVSGTGCHRRSRCGSSSGCIAGAWVFRSHRSASPVTGFSRLTTLQIYLGSRMATSSRLRRCSWRKRRRRTTTTTTSLLGRSLVFPMGSYPCGCAGGSLPGTAGKGGDVCSLTR